MKAADLRPMTVDQLDDEALKLKKEQFNLRFQRATNQLENTARVRIVAPRHRAHQDHRGAEARRAACIQVRCGGQASNQAEARSALEVQE